MNIRNKEGKIVKMVEVELEFVFMRENGENDFSSFIFPVNPFVSLKPQIDLVIKHCLERMLIVMEEKCELIGISSLWAFISGGWENLEETYQSDLSIKNKFSWMSWESDSE